MWLEPLPPSREAEECGLITPLFSGLGTLGRGGGCICIMLSFVNFALQDVVARIIYYCILLSIVLNIFIDKDDLFLVYY